MKHFQPITQHHALSRSFGGNSLPENIVLLKENIHRALHTIFGDRHVIGQIRDILEISKGSLDPIVYYHLSDTIAMYEENPMGAFKAKLFDPDKFKRRNESIRL